MDEALIVSDTSCLIVLSKTGQLDLLHDLFSQVFVTPEVVREFGEPLPNWISVQEVQMRPFNVFLKLNWISEKQVR